MRIHCSDFIHVLNAENPVVTVQPFIYYRPTIPKRGLHLYLHVSVSFSVSWNICHTYLCPNKSKLSWKSVSNFMLALYTVWGCLKFCEEVHIRVTVIYLPFKSYSERLTWLMANMVFCIGHEKQNGIEINSFVSFRSDVCLCHEF